MKPGKHLVELRKEKYASVSKEVSISAGDLATSGAGPVSLNGSGEIIKLKLKLDTRGILMLESFQESLRL